MAEFGWAADKTLYCRLAQRTIALALLFVATSAFGQLKDVVVAAPADALAGTNQQKCAPAYGGLTCVYEDAGVIKIVTTVDGIKWRGPDTIGPGTSPTFAMAEGVGGVAYKHGYRTLYRFYRNGAWGPPFELSKNDFGAGTPSIDFHLSTMYVAVAYAGGIWFAEFPADNPAAARREHVRRGSGAQHEQQSWSHAAITVTPRIGGGAPQVRIAYFNTLVPDSGLSPSFALAVADRPATPQPMWLQQDVEIHYQQYTKNGEGFSLSAATELRTGDFDLIASFTIPKTPPQKVTRFYRQNVRQPSPWQITPVLQNKLAQVSVATQVFGCASRVRIVVAEEGGGPVWVRTGVPGAKAVEWYQPQAMGSGGGIGHATFYSVRAGNYTPAVPKSLDVDAVYLDGGKLHSWRHSWSGETPVNCRHDIFIDR